MPVDIEGIIATDGRRLRERLPVSDAVFLDAMRWRRAVGIDERTARRAVGFLRGWYGDDELPADLRAYFATLDPEDYPDTVREVRRDGLAKATRRWLAIGRGLLSSVQATR